MRLAFVCNEAPYPATHGGRADVWRRLCAMSASGVSVFLVFWAGDGPDEQPSEAALSRMQREAPEIRFYTIRRSMGERATRLFRLTRWPSHVASRALHKPALSSLLADVRAFRPDAVWLDSIYGGVVARQLAGSLNVPLFCRSHNIEHLYMARQVAKATKFRDRLAWSLNLPHLEAFEDATLRASATYFDISVDDLSFWRERGLTNGEWLPPLIDKDFANAIGTRQAADPEFDVGYLGNLFAPNNVDGILWFMSEVVPILRKKRPSIRIFISGSRPRDELVSLAKRSSVTLIANPPDIVPILRNARVLINPVFSGSGVNVKAVDMLFTSAHLVSTTQGVAGLPPEVTRHFSIANDAEGFAEHIDAGLRTIDGDVDADRAPARAEFLDGRILRVLNTIQECIQARSGEMGQAK